MNVDPSSSTKWNRHQFPRYNIWAQEERENFALITYASCK